MTETTKAFGQLAAVEEILENDDGYEIIPDWRPAMAARGRKCGRCGMKFEAGVAYGFKCPDGGCPAGWNL